MIGLVDMLATFAAVARVRLPADAGPDSFNVLPALLDGPHPPIREHLILQNYNGKGLALRNGPWKFIPGEGPPDNSGGPQLYDLQTDIGETTNLAGEKPEIVGAPARTASQAAQGRIFAAVSVRAGIGCGLLADL